MTSVQDTNLQVWGEFKDKARPVIALGVRAGSVLLAGGTAGPLGMLVVPVLENIADSVNRNNKEEARARYSAAESVATRLKAKPRTTPPEKLQSLLQQITCHAIKEPIDEKIRLVAAAALSEESGDVATIEEMELADWVARTPLPALRAFDVLTHAAFGDSRVGNYYLPENGKKNICLVPLGDDFKNSWRKRFPHYFQEYEVFNYDKQTRFLIHREIWLDAAQNVFTSQINAAAGRGNYWPTAFLSRLHNAFVVEREVIEYQIKLDREAKC